MPVNVKLRCPCGVNGGGHYRDEYPPVGSLLKCPACGERSARVLAPSERVTAYSSVKLEGESLSKELDRRAADHNIRVALPAHFEKEGRPVPKRLLAKAEKRKAMNTR